MSDGALRRIAAVEARPGYRLLITWEDGQQAVVDMTETVGQGGVFAPLQDEATFARVRVGARRRTIEWPQPYDYNGEPVIDIDAESLFVLAHQQRSRGLFERLLDMFRHQTSHRPFPT